MTQIRSTHSTRFLQGSELLFSLNTSSSRQVKPLLEGHVSFVNATTDYYLCTLHIEPFGNKVIDFRGSAWLPGAGDTFLVSLLAWTNGPSISDLFWPVRPRSSKVLFSTRYDRLLNFTKFSSYSLSVSFQLHTYRVRAKELFFPLKKGAGYCYPSFSNQSLFLPRNLHRSLARHRFLGFTGIMSLLTPLLFTTRSALLGPILQFGVSPLELLFSYESCSRIVLLFRFLRSCSSRRIRKLVRIGLSKLVCSRHRATFSSPLLLPTLQLNFFQAVCASFMIPRTTVFSYHLLGSVLSGEESVELPCNPALYYLKFASKYNAVAAQSPANTKFYSPLLSSVPTRRRRFLRIASRRPARVAKSRS